MHLTAKDTLRLEMKGWKMICQINGIWKQSGVVTFISDKVEFKTQFVRRDKEVHYILIKCTIHH
jgi:hypothetical protein